MNFRDRAVLLLATGFSVGHVPLAPGTFGTLLGIPVCFILADIGLPFMMIGAATFVLFAVWIAGEAERLISTRDAPCIVIDEMAGIVIAMFGVPMTPLNLTAGFIAFRALDIIKPFPARRIDAKVSGGWGIVMDDVVAGFYSNLFLRIIASVFFQVQRSDANGLVYFR
jgi:phosphatidylglycerophosphatase A